MSSSESFPLILFLEQKSLKFFSLALGYVPSKSFRVGLLVFSTSLLISLTTYSLSSEYSR